MIKSFNIIGLFSIFFSLCIGASNLDVSLFNFKNATVDKNDDLAREISEQLNTNFIDFIKSDMSFIPNLNLINTKKLDDELSDVNKKLLDEIRKDLDEGILNVIPRSRFYDIIEKISGENFGSYQINSIADSLIISIAEVTKDITRDMLLSNTRESGQPAEITISDLYNFINNVTEESINNSTYASLIASSNKDFDTDIVVTSEYEIHGDELIVNLIIYNFSDLSLLGEVSSKGSLNKINVIIKDLEFKLLSKIGFSLNNEEKINLCRFSIENFSKDYYSLYFSKIISTEDIKELSYRLQIEDPNELIIKHYYTLFNALIDKNYLYSIKFYNNDNFYQIYSTEKVTDSSFFVNVLNSNWSTEIGGSDNLKNIHSGTSLKKNSKVIAEIDFDVIQAVQFKKKQDSFVNLLKQISIYSAIVISGILVIGGLF